MHHEREDSEPRPEYDANTVDRVRWQGSTRGRTVRRVLISVGIVILALFIFDRVPLPGRLNRALDAWVQHSAERRAQVEQYEKTGWPDDNYPVKGSVELRTPAKDTALHARECESGQRRMFYGVIVRNTAEPGMAARVVVPESGTPHVTLERSGEEDLTFERQNCSLWDVLIEPANAIHNTIQDLQGHANFQCSKQTGSVQGTLQFKECH